MLSILQRGGNRWGGVGGTEWEFEGRENRVVGGGGGHKKKVMEEQKGKVSG